MRTKVSVESGKAVLELNLGDLREGMGKSVEETDCFCVSLLDARGQQVFYCEHPVREDDECVICLLHPHLWEGVSHPCLYRLEIYARGGKGRELLEKRLVPLREMTKVSDGTCMLNGSPFVIKAVVYDGLSGGCVRDRSLFWAQVGDRLKRLARMGANTVVLRSFSGASGEEQDKIRELCDRQGLLLWPETGKETGAEAGAKALGEGADCVEGGGLFDLNGSPTAQFYLQKAKWSKEPFVHLHPHNLRKQPDGCFAVTVYSNAGRVALLVDGHIFGFQEDGPEFVFQDIAIKRRPFTLTAEAGDCSMSMACY